jgi:hypothetical protein
LNLASPQPTADCQSPGGLPPGIALGCGLTSDRSSSRENYENEPLVRQKHIKKKKIIRILSACVLLTDRMYFFFKFRLNYLGNLK